MAKKPNIGKALKKATKTVSKTVVQPAAKTVVQPAVKTVVQPAAKAIEKKVVQPAVKNVVQPTAKAIEKEVVQPAAKTIGLKSTAKSNDDTKKKLQEKDNKIQMQQTEITNLKYQITSTEKEKADLLNQNNKMITNINELNNKIGSLNKQVGTLDTRINAPLVKEGFSGEIKNVNPVKRSDAYVNYDINRSGLKATASEYKRLYGDYYAGYQDGETMIEDELIPQIDYLASTDVNGMEYSFVALKQQNKTLEAQIEETSDIYSTDFQKSKYMEGEILSVKKRNAILFFLFYFVCIVFAYSLFVENTVYSIYAKIGIVLTLLLYPYWIAYLSQIASFIFNYSIALFRGTPYSSSQ